jgi:hypothetical protein
VAFAQIPALVVAEIDVRRECRAAVEKEQDEQQPEHDQGEDDQPEDYEAAVVFHFFSFFGGGQSPETSTPVCRSTRHWSEVNRTCCAALLDSRSIAVATATTIHNRHSISVL